MVLNEIKKVSPTGGDLEGAKGYVVWRRLSLAKKIQ